MHALISGLARQHDVSVLSLVDSTEEQEEAVAKTQAYCREVVTVPTAKSARKRLRQIAATASPWSYERMMTWAPALQRELDRLLARERFDVVQLEFAHTAVFRVRGPGGDSPAVCLDEHNIEYEILFRTARASTSALRRAYNAIDGLKVRSEERRAWASVDGCALTSARDQRMLLGRAPATRTAIVPNGVDLDFFRPRAPGRSDAASLLFFGAIDYYPNTDAVLFFLNEVMPRLTQRDPRIVLRIVGRRPPESVLARRSSNVEVMGAVDDVRPWIERATAVIVPLRIGGGTRLKILEAMAMGKAIVSTSLGAEGIDGVEERDLLIADDGERFAMQIIRVLQEPQLAARIGRAARQLVETRYGWDASIDRLSDFHAELVGARSRR